MTRQRSSPRARQRTLFTLLVSGALACASLTGCDDGDSVATPCAAGTFGPGADDCSPCASGTYCPEGSEAPVDCAAGGGWDNDGDPSTACVALTACSASEYETAAPSATSDRACTELTMCVPGQYVSEAATATSDRACGACATGAFSDTTNAERCTEWSECPVGRDEETPPTDVSDRVCVVVEWVRQFGTTGSDGVSALAVDQDGSVIVLGVTEGALPGQTESGSLDCFVRKYDIDGGELWTRQFGAVNEEGSAFCIPGAIAVGEDGVALVAGAIIGALPGQVHEGDQDAFVRRYDADGTLVWTHQFGTEQLDEALAVAVTADGDVLVAGTVGGALPDQTSVGGNDAFMRRYTADGTLVRTWQFGTIEYDVVYSIDVDVDGTVFVAGETEGTLPGQTLNAGDGQAFVRSYNASGDERWTRQFGAGPGSRAAAVVSDGAGGAFVVGDVRDALPGQVSSAQLSAYVRRYDADGEVLWTRQFGSDRLSYANAASVDEHGSVFVAGQADGSITGDGPVAEQNAFVRQYDADGGEGWTLELGVTTSTRGSAVGTPGDGVVVFAGDAFDALPEQTAAGGRDAFVMRLGAP
mgnify:CR=1 FL=1